MLVDSIAFCFWQDAEVRAMAKERQKKDNHNLSEYALSPPPLIYVSLQPLTV